MACIEIGVGSKARGICCIAVGDNTHSRGAFQVNVGEMVTIPAIPLERTILFIEELKDAILTYHELSKTKYAPDLFGKKAEAALQIVIEILQARCAVTPDEPEKKD